MKAILLLISIITSCNHKAPNVECHPVLVVKWEHSIYNPENEEYLVEVAFNKKTGPDYTVSKQDIKNVTQEEFNQRYGITKDTICYKYVSSCQLK